GGHETENPQEDEDPGRGPRAPRHVQETGEQGSGEEEDCPQVAGDAAGAIDAAEPDSPWDPKPQSLLELSSPSGKDVVPGVLLGALGNVGQRPGPTVLPARAPGPENRFPRHVRLRMSRAAGEQL